MFVSQTQDMFGGSHMKFSIVLSVNVTVFFVRPQITVIYLLWETRSHSYLRPQTCKITVTLRKHAYIILTPLKPHFYVVKLGFTGVYIIFLISAQKHRLWVLVRTASARRF